jgi:2-polyprenyl-6-methoxyphenol hydroxylase-like FAD-dependent oxidoreductase
MSSVVIVVGAGITGLSLALGLVKLGYHVHLVERRSDLRKRGGGTFLLQPNAIQALEEISPEAMTPLQDMGILIPSNGKMYAWWMVRDALLCEVEKHHPNIQLWLGCTFCDLEDDPASPVVQARFTRTEDSSSMSLEGVLLVGADGVNSSIRTAVFGLPPATSCGSKFWRGTISVPDDCEVLTPLLTKGVCPLGFINFGPTILVLFSFDSKYKGIMTWSVNTKEPQVVGGHPKQVVEPYLDENNAETAKIFDAVFELADPEDLQHAFQNKTVDPDEWGGKGRVVLLGDAAHAMRPAGGLGGAMALEDCVVLIRLLKDRNAIKDRPTTEKTILQFKQSRLPRVRRISQDQQERAEKAYKQGVCVTGPGDKEFFEWVYKGV